MVVAAVVLAGADVSVGPPRPAVPARADSPLTDPEIVAALAKYHATTLAAAQVAQASARDRRVGTFARAMARKARAAQRREAPLRRELGGGELDGGFRRDAEQAFAGLRQRPRGRAFDRGYLDDQIQSLTVILYTIHNRMRPYAQSQALRDELAALAAEAGEDLAAAEALRDALALTDA